MTERDRAVILNFSPDQLTDRRRAEFRQHITGLRRIAPSSMPTNL